MKMFEIVLVDRDQKETILGIVKSEAEVAYITESPKYLGTWIRENRKLLRWNRGEIHIRVREEEPGVSSQRTIHFGKNPIYELTIRYSHDLKYITLNAQTIIGYDSKKAVLWQTASFTKLADLLGKELAYQVMQYYELYLSEFNVEGAM